ncbi:metallophosphoesterase family protein [Deinococcus arenicola]|uniref:Metallophosphoesterase family protein n=1 Tax=Deinococcus arenicola TaxID=2994950 RepID=A0ABU4DSL0_9DEIO|nr:metallophosphoesterase family protein [Deinococcus sp. ZS9-10]MDV6375417.1 metallophosphoesterase family protein [Deinococcus sp. ZS9-10]
MRVAVFSDAHGNAFALEAVLADIRAASPDLIINLGDQIEGSADPARAAALQAELGAIEVRGNNEEKLWPGGRRAKISLELGAWLDTQIDAATLARLAALPLTARAVDGRLFACHGTPESAWGMLLWHWEFDLKSDVEGAGFYRARDPRELRELVEPLNAEVVLCGHTHRPGATRVGDTLVVNTGPVSDQVDGDPRARWTLLEERGGNWAADFRAVPFDIEAAVRWSQAHSPFGEFEAQLMRSGMMVGRGG